MDAILVNSHAPMVISAWEVPFTTITETKLQSNSVLLVMFAKSMKPESMLLNKLAFPVLIKQLRVKLSVIFAHQDSIVKNPLQSNPLLVLLQSIARPTTEM
jgi:hypothetical protein